MHLGTGVFLPSLGAIVTSSLLRATATAGDGASILFRRRSGFSVLLLAVVSIDVAEVTPGLDDVPDAPLQLLCLGEAAIDLAVPQDDAALLLLLRVHRSYLDDKYASCARLQGDFAQGRGESGQQLLGVLRHIISEKTVQQ